MGGAPQQLQEQVETLQEQVWTLQAEVNYLLLEMELRSTFNAFRLLRAVEDGRPIVCGCVDIDCNS